MTVVTHGASAHQTGSSPGIFLFSSSSSHFKPHSSFLKAVSRQVSARSSVHDSRSGSAVRDVSSAARFSSGKHLVTSLFILPDEEKFNQAELSLYKHYSTARPLRSLKLDSGGGLMGLRPRGVIRCVFVCADVIKPCPITMSVERWLWTGCKVISITCPEFADWPS
ncbi:Uncharacterized protein DAT39_022951 [Clarias magur]|uniref:Uncharacterized protein n=1 Tax=Clarias magur TaxID=1594786 RepID=A0A8J4T1Q5_CLAMG|nr:Uncharacterized protein DAT39_022951 [Clarias magur]